MGGYDNGDFAGFAKSLAVNGAGLFIMTRAFGNVMAQNGGGSIINIGSYMGSLGPNEWLYEGTNGTMGALGVPDYFYHKGGMHNLTRFLPAATALIMFAVTVWHLAAYTAVSMKRS